MTVAPQEMVDKLLLSNSSASAYRALKDMGYSVTLSHLDVRIAQLRAAGKRGTMPKPTEFAPEDTGVADAASGSAWLLRACLNLYARKAFAKRMTLEEAMLTTLYSPEQVQAWRRAA